MPLWKIGACNYSQLCQKQMDYIILLALFIICQLIFVSRYLELVLDCTGYKVAVHRTFNGSALLGTYIHISIHTAIHCGALVRLGLGLGIGVTGGKTHIL